MTLTIICLFTIALLIFMTLKYPVIKIGKVSLSAYWVIALMGALILIILRLLPLSEVIEKTKISKVNPLEIIILFISVTFMSIVLDEIGFFNYLADYTCKKAKTSQLKLFTLLYLLVGLLTIFTSNDIIILTFTPFICAFCRKTKINPLPYLIGEFVAANTFSTMLLISNPTNIFIGLSFNLSFIDFFMIMFWPTVAMILVAYLFLYLLFKKTLTKPLTSNDFSNNNLTLDKGLVFLSLTHLIICTTLLVISSFINLKMWLICLMFASSLLIFLAIINRRVLYKAIKRSPFDLIPFLLGMFVLILGLEKAGFTKELGLSLQKITSNMAEGFIKNLVEAYIYGFSSIFADNLVNNIPMSMASIEVLKEANAISVYAVIIGSNIGAYLTPIGALAGIMWLNILRKEGVSFNFVKFMRYGLLIVPFVALVGLFVLSLMF